MQHLFADVLGTSTNSWSMLPFTCLFLHSAISHIVDTGLKQAVLHCMHSDRIVSHYSGGVV